MRVNMNIAMAMAAAIIASAHSDYKKMQELSQINYYSRGHGGKRPRTFSGVARARRQAKKLRNSK